MKQPICPFCSTPLDLSVSCATEWQRKINKNGSISKKIIKNYTKPVFDSVFLVCPECPFQYDTEHIQEYTRYAELDKWIDEHMEELDNWE